MSDLKACTEKKFICDDYVFEIYVKEVKIIVCRGGRTWYRHFSLFLCLQKASSSGSLKVLTLLSFECPKISFVLNMNTEILNIKYKC